VQALNWVAKKHPDVLPEFVKNFPEEIEFWEEELSAHKKTGGSHSAYLMILHNIHEEFEDAVDIEDIFSLCSVGLYMRAQAEVHEPPHPSLGPVWPDASEALARMDGLFRRTSSASKSEG
jgi:hypothetical protein